MTETPPEPEPSGPVESEAAGLVVDEEPLPEALVELVTDADAAAPEVAGPVGLTGGATPRPRPGGQFGGA